MRRIFRDRLLVGLLSTATVAVGCSRLTAPDWGLIPLDTAGTSTGATDAGGAAAGEATGGVAGTAGGEAGETSGGEAGASDGKPSGGKAGSSGTAGAGGSAGMGGVAGSGMGGVAGSGGTGGASGSAGMAGTTGSAGAPPCTGTPGAIGDAMVLFAGPAAASAARGGRAGLDATCEAERVKLNLTQTTTHAFITVADKDSIASLPDKFPDLPKVGRRVVGPTGIQLATSFSDLIDGTIEQSLECAKVFPVGTKAWLTGNDHLNCSKPVAEGPFVCGGFSSPQDTCNGWTFGTYDAIVQARFGSTTLNDGRWLTVATSTAPFLRESCDVATDPILCLAYTP
jgi:hypothetical protein